MRAQSKFHRCSVFAGNMSLSWGFWVWVSQKLTKCWNQDLRLRVEVYISFSDVVCVLKKTWAWVGSWVFLRYCLSTIQTQRVWVDLEFQGWKNEWKLRVLGLSFSGVKWMLGTRVRVESFGFRAGNSYWKRETPLYSSKLGLKTCSENSLSGKSNSPDSNSLNRNRQSCTPIRFSDVASENPNLQKPHTQAKSTHWKLLRKSAPQSPSRVCLLCLQPPSCTENSTHEDENCPFVGLNLHTWAQTLFCRENSESGKSDPHGGCMRQYLKGKNGSCNPSPSVHSPNQLHFNVKNQIFIPFHKG